MSSTHPLYVVILAAGKGTRMKSDQAKVLHEVYFAPMVHHVIDAVAPLEPAKTAVIIGHQRTKVAEALSGYDVEHVIQEEQLGTGHAVLSAEPAIPAGSGTVMILCGDTPLIRTKTLQDLVEQHRNKGADVTLMTTNLENPTNYGRILTNEAGTISAIVEEKDADAKQKQITEINAGIYCVERDFLFTVLKQVGTDNSQGEVYLTDIVSIGVKEGKKVERFVTPLAMDVLGVNSRLELSQAHSEIQNRHNRELMLSGITMHSPETITVAPQVSIGRDSLLQPGCMLLGNTQTGKHCTIGPGAILDNCRLGDNVIIGPYCVLSNQEIESDTSLPAQTVSQ